MKYAGTSRAWALAVVTLALFSLGARSRPLPAKYKPRSVAEAKRSYARRHDFASLKFLSKQLHPGTKRSEVRALLGKPDFSPTEGQDRYPSSQMARVDEGKGKAHLGLVVDYRAGDKITEQVQSVELTPLVD